MVIPHHREAIANIMNQKGPSENFHPLWMGCNFTTRFSFHPGQNLEIPTRPTNVRCLASITSCGSAKIFRLGPGQTNSLNLQLPGVVLSKCVEK
jgi:hypothetical protein